MTERDPTTSHSDLPTEDATNDDYQGEPWLDLMRNWRASLAEERAYFETGDLPNPRMNMTDIMGAVEAAGVKVALAPARTLEQMTLKAEVAEYFLGGIKVVEDALAKEQRGNDCMQNMMALGLLRDLLRLLPSEGRPEH